MIKGGALLVIAILSIGHLFAQEQQLTFAEAISIGLNDNFLMKNQRNNLKSFKTDKAAQISSFTPSLGVTAGISQTSGPQVDPELGLVNSRTDNFRGSIGANLVIFNGNNRIHSLKSSSYRLEGQQLMVERAEQDVMNQVALQFLQVLLDQELLRIAEENLISQQHTLDQITGFVEAGTRAEVDKYRQEADVKSFELQVIQAKNNLTNDKAALAQTLQLDPSQEFVVVRPNWNIDQIRSLNLNLDELYITALNARADYKRFETVENAAYHDFKGSFNGYLPFLSGFVSYGSSYFNANNPNQPADDFSTQLENRRSTSYGLNLTIPLWDRLQTKNSRVFNKINYENAQNELENAEKTVKIQVQTAYNNFQDVKLGYEVSLVQYDASKLAYETQQESYSVGLATQVELAVANASFVNAQSNLASTGYRLLFQKILLDYATGMLSVSSIDN
jgi:outer membrane protein